MEIYDLSAQAIDGTAQKLDRYKGKVMLVVNVASKCGFTPQYSGLERLYEKYASKGLVVLGFPCDQFGHQEPGDDESIQSFCSASYGVTFPMFAKIEVNGPNTHPIYRLLKREAPGVLGTTSIKWNFTKFLVDRSGKVVRRYASADKPSKIESDLAELLERSTSPSRR
jgi:glutathione peroxidase